MGAWDAGSFHNDTALDWVHHLCQSADVTPVRTALDRAVEQRLPPQPSLLGRLLGRRPVEQYLEADAACEALAAAEIVAFWLGRPAADFPAPDFPDNLREWARRHADSFSPE